jgi:hypothetical protein
MERIERIVLDKNSKPDQVLENLRKEEVSMRNRLAYQRRRGKSEFANPYERYGVDYKATSKEITKLGQLSVDALRECLIHSAWTVKE